MVRRLILPTILLPLLAACDGGDPHAARDAPPVALPPGSWLGHALCDAGDLDGDGLSDVFAGAPGVGQGGLLAGAVLALSGRDGRILARLDGTRARAVLGSSVVSLGDLDGDGLRDLAVGAPKDATPGLATGSIVVLSGRDLSRLWQKAGPSTGAHLGDALANVGDVDGDGRADLLVGAPAHDTSRAGSALLYSGATGSVLLRLDGERPDDRFGRSVCGPGDVDGDGLPDLAVGAPDDRLGGDRAGRAALFTSADGSLLLQWTGSVDFDYLGSALAGPGDLDRDGVPDLCVGVPADDGAHPGAGVVLALSGRDGHELWRAPGRAAGEDFGASLVAAGDVDGDGVPDLLAGSVYAAGGRGAWRSLSGATGELLAETAGARAGTAFGFAACMLADSAARGGEVSLAAGEYLADEERGAVRIIALPDAR